MADDDKTFEDKWANYDSGPYCKHWGTPGLCEECAQEQVAEYHSLTVEQLLHGIRAIKEYYAKAKHEG